MKRSIKQMIVLNAMSLMGFLHSACGQVTFEQKLQLLYSNTVDTISPQSLHDKLKANDSIYLLDARKAEEFEVSHLKDARWVGYKSFDHKRVNDIPKDKPVVVYCTVGYRSEKIGEYLKKAGFKNVYNLYGSIVHWKNEGYPVYNTEGEETDKVHTYSKSWSKWLKKGEAVYD